jgi:TM2 domain-containing membrane protein YozV
MNPEAIPGLLVLSLIFCSFVYRRSSFCGLRTGPPVKTNNKSDLEWLIVLLLVLFGGLLGLHRFYAGRRVSGLLFLLTLGLFGLGATIDFFMVLFNRFIDSKGNTIMYSSTPSKNNNSAPSVAEALKDFADLRDKGIITEDEFVAKKKDLLNT